MRRLNAFIAGLLLTLPAYLSAQTKNKLSGTVSDSGKALSYVTIRIFKQNNTAPVKRSEITFNHKS